MRNFSMGLALTLLPVSFAAGACIDTTLVIASGSAGYTPSTGVYDPTQGGALNELIRTCTEQNMKVTLRFQDAARGDTLKLANEIIVSGRAGGRTTEIVGQGTSGDIVTLLENIATDPQLLNVNLANATTLRNLGFARKAINQTASSVAIAAKNSKVIGCHFWMADTSGGTPPPGPLLDIISDSVLVERSLFRAPPAGSGWCTAIKTSGTTALAVEIRSNVFYSTGIRLTATAANYRIYANTFAGVRNGWNAIIVGGGATPDKNLAIEHNLFAHKNSVWAPIAFNSTAALSPDGIFKNAWTRGPANVSLVVNGSNAAVTLSTATGANANVALPKGFNNYGTGSYDIKEYPLTQLRNDSLLSRKHADFGKIYKVFAQTSWFGDMPDIRDLPPAKKIYPDFVSFDGKAWVDFGNDIKVGAFVVQDTVERPAPLDSGAQGSALKFEIAAEATKIKVAARNFDLNYYKSTASTLTPDIIYYFFSNSLDTLKSSNDSTILKTRVGAANVVRKAYPGDTASLVVPTDVRVPDKDIYVKMLHYRKGFQAAVQSHAAIATVKGVPTFPLNDLVLTINDASSDFSNGKVALTVTRGAETIDSVRVVAASLSGEGIDTLTRAVSGGTMSLSFEMDSLPKGSFVFYAVPVARPNKSGSPTANSRAVSLRASLNDSVYVTLKTGGCVGATGEVDNPFCVLDTAAFNAVATNNGGTIIIKNATATAVPMVDITIPESAPSDTFPMAIIVPTAAGSGKYEENRPVFRGNTRAALTINRRNVTLRGFLIEMPAANTSNALIVDKGGAVIDGNIFRAASKGTVEGFAVRINVGGSDLRLINNVVWGFTKQVQIANSTAQSVIRIMHNTFVEDQSLSNAGKTIGIASTGSVLNAVVANNFFSGIAVPMDTSVAGKPGLVLDHNVYTSSKPTLQDLTDLGDLDSSTRIGASNIYVANYVDAVEAALDGVIACTELSRCNPLYAGSSTNIYQTTVSTDMTGKSRTNRKEVGALEYPSNPSSVLGTLSLQLSLVLGQAKVNFVVSSKNYDPSEADSVHVTWSLNANFDNVPAANHKSFPISKLATGSFTDLADNLDFAKTFYFRATLGKGSSRSFAATNSIAIPISVEAGDCVFSKSKTVCPGPNSIFAPEEPIWAARLQTKVVFNKDVDSGAGVFKNPVFESIGTQKVPNLELITNFPKVTFVAEAPGLGVARSDQFFTATIVLNFALDLKGASLFLLPADSNGLAAYYPAWSLVPSADGASTTIVIKSSQAGTQEFAFARLKPGLEPGVVAAADASPPLFDFAELGDSSGINVQVTFNGTAFKTANPLVLVSMVRAGGIVKNRHVLDPRYHSKSVLLSSGFTDLAPAIRTERLYKYLIEASKADSAPNMEPGLKKPFTIDSISTEDFNAITVLDGPDLEIGADGTLGATTVTLNVNKAFRLENNYEDSAGKATRSIEVVYSVFDGAKWSRGRGFIRTRFSKSEVHFTERVFGEDNGSGYPLSSNAKPVWNLFGYPWDEENGGNLFHLVSDPEEGKGKWDNNYMRLMSYKGSGSGASSFNIYNGTNPGAIKFDSGQAVWGGATSRVEPSSVLGTSLDYQPFLLNLPANLWTDFASPFNFPMKWKDILDASGKTAAQVPAFRYSHLKQGWLPMSADSIVKPWNGMTVKPTADILLKFPIVDIERSASAATAAPKASARSKNLWSARIEAANGKATMSLGVGIASTLSLYPEAPNVPGQDFRVALLRETPEGREKVSQIFLPGEGDWQGHWPLHIAASKGAGNIGFTVAENPQGHPLYLVDVLHKNAVPLSADAPVRVTEEDLSANEYHIVAGDGAYLKSFLDGLLPLHLLALSNYPNPFSGSTLIRYALPESFGKVAFNLKVRDFRGRTVWEKTIRGGSALSYLWDGKDRGASKLPSGVYTLSLEASAVGKPVFRATRRMLRL